MNRDVEKYLKTSTRGLWGRKREEIEEELATHIQGRVTAHQIAGLSEDDAVQKALNELGHPKEVSNGMTKLYTLPAALGFGAVVAALGLSTALFLSQTAAQTLSSSFNWPSKVCLEAVDTEWCASAEPWFNLDALKAVLEPQGVEIEQTPRGVSLLFPGSSVPVILAQKTATSLGDENGTLPAEYQPLNGYYTLPQFLYEVAQEATVPVRVSGWDILNVEIGETKFGVDMTPRNAPEWSHDKTPAYYFYMAYLNDGARELTTTPQEGTVTLNFVPANNESNETVVIKGLENGIYGILSRITPLPDEPADRLTLGSEVVRSREDGTLMLRLPETHQRFVGTPKSLNIGDTLVVRLTGEANRGSFEYELIPPEQVGLESP